MVQLVWVMAVPGQTPTSPVTTESVQVTAEPARAAKPPAEPSDGPVWAEAAWSSEPGDEAPQPKESMASARSLAVRAWRIVVRSIKRFFMSVFLRDTNVDGTSKTF